MSITARKLSLLILLITACQQLLQAQGASSPYTRFGLGDVRSTVFSNNRYMGRIAAGLGSRSYVNYTNPASYADIFVTSLDFGAAADVTRLVTTDTTFKGGNGSFSHLTLSFPVMQDRWGMSFGVIPYSFVNYDFENQVTDDEFGEYTEQLEGSGSLYHFYFGNGVKYKGFYAGINMGVLFGRFESSDNVVFPDPTQFFNTRNLTEQKISGFYYNFGLQYKRKLKVNINDIDKEKKQNVYMSVGLYGASQNKVNSNLSSFWQRYQQVNGVIFVKDTIGSVESEKTKINIPGFFGTGVTFFDPGKWLIGADFTWNKWSAFSINTHNQQLGNSWYMKMGGEYKPQLKKGGLNNSGKDVSKRMVYKMVYRAGFYAGKSEYIIDNQQANEYGITFGVGIPVRRSISWINLGFEVGNLGANLDNFAQERFFKLTASFNLNDKWFLKQKFD